jgi:hypothetical protein
MGLALPARKFSPAADRVSIPHPVARRDVGASLQIARDRPAIRPRNLAAHVLETCNLNWKETPRMRFLSIYKTAETGVPPTPEMMEKMGKFIEESMKSGELIATEGCLPSALGARVRLSNGKTTVVDGPFTESKELVGGFALLQADSKEHAIEMAKRFLAVTGEGECELRQIYEG